MTDGAGPPTGADPVAVGEALVGWLVGRFGPGVALAEPPATASGGLDSWIHLVRFTGPGLPEPWRAPLVARVAPTAERAGQAHREATVQGWCAVQGFPTPAVLAVLDPGEVLDVPVQVMARAPGVTMADALGRRPWGARSLLDRLAGLQVALHQLPTDDLAGTGGGSPIGSVVDRRLRLPRAIAPRLDHPGLATALAEVEALVPTLVDAPASLCHGDLHPLNVLVAGHAATVIDWTDAGLGDRHADVARTALLLRLAAITAASGAERAVLRVAAPALAGRFLRCYRARLPVDPARLAMWEPVHLVHAWAQVLASDAGLLDGPTAGRGAPSPLGAPGLARWLEARLTRCLTELC